MQRKHGFEFQSQHFPNIWQKQSPQELLLGAYFVLKTLVAHGGFEPPISALRDLRHVAK